MMGHRARFDEITAARQFSNGQIFDDFVNRSDVGLAIFDEEMRCQAVNPWLATRIGLAVKLNIGKHLTEVLGEVASRLEPGLREVLNTGRPFLNFATEGPPPLKRNGKRWIVNLFPTKDTNGKVKQMAAILLEVEAAGSEHGNVNRVASNPELLRSWKEIASYMGTCIKTVQRWERAFQFPIRRVSAGKGSVVFALRSEIDSWMRSHAAKGHEYCT